MGYEFFKPNWIVDYSFVNFSLYMKHLNPSGGNLVSLKFNVLMAVSELFQIFCCTVFKHYNNPFINFKSLSDPYKRILKELHMVGLHELQVSSGLNIIKRDNIVLLFNTFTSINPFIYIQRDQSSSGGLNNGFKLATRTILCVP